MTRTRSRRPISVFTTAGLTFLLFLSFLCFFAARWFVTVYGRIGFDSILFTLQSSLSGVQSGLVKSFLLRGALPAVLCTILSCAILLLTRKIPVRSRITAVTAVAVSLGLLLFAAVDVELTDYIWQLCNSSQLYEDEYADPEEVEITFPEEKRNLVYIMLESMETTFCPRSWAVPARSI